MGGLVYPQRAQPVQRGSQFKTPELGEVADAAAVEAVQASLLEKAVDSVQRAGDIDPAFRGNARFSGAFRPADCLGPLSVGTGSVPAAW